ncbi:MAG: amino acid permease [Candidatus Omnitrophica bacterium]|nr:amino acid permease [Candidatus Omnitrophota bacterium]
MDKQLKRGLNLLDVFCVATGAMFSSGLFILPGLAYVQAGPAVVLSYVLAGLLTLPALLSVAELTTAMPKAAGDYFYIMRGFGPLFGTLAGFSSWFSLSLKGAFALIGMGAYLSIITDIPLNVIAVACCLFFVFLNLIGVKIASRFQIFLVAGLITILTVYFFWGLSAVNLDHFTPFFSEGMGKMFATAGFVFISYGGLTKIAALAEETEQPGRILPLGMILSIIVTTVMFAAVIFITVGVLDLEMLKHDLTPVSDGAGVFGGELLKIIVSVGAFLAFISTANAGIMTASRYPLGMSRDKLLPKWFNKVSPRFKTPYVSILVTGLFMVASILLLRLEVLVKIASSLLIVLFIFANLTVIMFRKSRITSYRPKFRSPMYPYIQIFGVMSGVFILVEMGTFIIFLTIGFLALGYLWYRIYARKRSSQDSALMHVLEKLVSKDEELASENLLTELRDIVMKRDDLEKDRFHDLIEKARVLDITEIMRAEDFFRKVSGLIGEQAGLDPDFLFDKFLKREKESSTVLRKGLAMPHVFVEKKEFFSVLLARAKKGVVFPNDEVAHVIFVLASSSDERQLHLRVLAAFAQVAQDPEFDKKWLEAGNEDALREVVLLAERDRGPKS